MKVRFFVSSIFKRFMQLFRKLKLKLKIHIMSKLKTVKLKEIDMRNLSFEEAIVLAKEFKNCKTVEEQQKFCKDHDLELTFEVNVNPVQQSEGKEAKEDDNKATIRETK